MMRARDFFGESAMRFGIFYEHQLPRPWAQDDEYQLMQNALEQIELADRLGIEYVWEVEHHFLEEYSHSSAPEVFLAAASQRTRNIRLGHGIIQTSPLYNHPARTAERVATLDLLSNGRVEFGSGESATTGEMGGFNIDPNLKREQWREGLEVAVRCLTETPFTGVEGKWVTMPPRNVVPKPRQRPHPPLWVAASRRDTIMLAAELGLGALTFAFIDPEEARGWTQAHERRLSRCSPIGELVNTDVACVTPMMVHRDEREAIRRGLEGGNFFGYSLAFFAAFGDHVPGSTNLWEDFQKRRRERGFDSEAAIEERKDLGAKVASGETTALRGAVGTPDQLRGYLRRFEEAGVDQLIFVLQAGRNRHEHICESIELFGREILPEFKDRDEKLRAQKAARLAPVVDAALARKQRNVPAMPAGYHVPAVAKELFKAAGGDALLEQIATESALGGGAIQERMPRELPPTE
jgi:alkanesulfonate monooxygenase SsuD/methylene tetrahydromethanopterin reductase-like flavin-dependent oxidoreductase (luciferase family)